MATKYTGLFGRGTLLKTLADNTSTTTSQYRNDRNEIWSRDSGSANAVSPSLISRDETLEEFNATDYKKSIFPNLCQNLDAKPLRPTTLQVEKTEMLKPKPRMVRSQRKSRTSIFDEIQHRNESHYQRIQAVAREQLALYEKKTREMEEKIKRQREEMHKKAQKFLNKLADQEAKKKEEKIYSSSYGRIWRHHRVMQRRALNLEPMNAQSPEMGPSGIT